LPLERILPPTPTLSHPCHLKKPWGQQIQRKVMHLVGYTWPPLALHLPPTAQRPMLEHASTVPRKMAPNSGLRGKELTLWGEWSRAVTQLGPTGI
jgi:hypothetical protein